MIETTGLEVHLLAAKRLQTGRLARIVQSFRLREAGGTQIAAMDVTNLIAIAGGRIALFDEPAPASCPP